MFSSGTVAILLLSISSALSVPFTQNPRGCDTILSKEQILQNEASFQQKLKLSSSPSFNAQAINATLNPTLNVHWHVISNSTDLSGGNLPDSQIAAQIKVLNEDYASVGISWNLASTNRIIDPNWFENVTLGSQEQTDMKNRLRKGGPADLNVYSTGFTLSNVLQLGYGTFPVDYAQNPKNDGVVILYSSVPGGTKVPFNGGRTLTHEVGHWVGLFHTFEGGCTGDGDFVADTAPEKEPVQSGCPIGRDTCPGDAFPDPVQNFMDYSDDSCMTNFTPGQAVRVKQQLTMYRGVQS